MRISRHRMFMGFAEYASMRSTCYRRSVGAVLVRNNNVISVGYNGPPSGEPHCTGKNCPSLDGCKRAVHAEINLLSRALLRSDEPSNLSVYVTESPCIECAQKIAKTPGVYRLFYLHEYRIKAGIDILIEGGLQTYRMTASGIITDYRTGNLVNEATL